MNIILPIIVQQLIDYRTRYNITQEGLAKMLLVTRITIARWERGYSKPSNMAVDQIRKVLQIKLCPTCGKELSNEATANR